MGGPRLRRLGRTAAVLLLVAASFSRPAAAQEPVSGYEQGIFEIRIPRLSTYLTATALVDSAGRLLLPLSPLLDFASVPAAPWDGDSLVVEWPAPAYRTVFDARTRTRLRGDDARVWESADVTIAGGEVYLSPPALADLLAGEVTVDWSNLTVVLTGERDFPVVARLDADTRRRAAEARRPARDASGGADDVPYPARSGGGLLSWGLSSAALADRLTSSARATLGASLLGGQLEVGGTASTDGFGSLPSRPFARYLRGFPGNPWLRQIRLGDVFTDGVVARGIRGVVIGNAPLIAPSAFAEVLLTPVVPSGWQYEVYQGDYLLGAAETDQHSPIEVPLSYGNTAVRVRAYGPAGQVTESELIYLTPVAQIPPGDLRYSLGAGACEATTCREYAYGDLRYGVSPRLTLGAGADAVGDTTGRRIRPFGLVSFTPHRQLSLEARAQSGTLARLSAAYATSANAALQAAVGWNAEESVVALPRSARWYADASGSAPLRGRWISAGFRMEGRQGSAADLLRATLTSTLERSYATVGLERGLERETLLFGGLTRRVAERWSSRLRDPLLSAGMGVAGSGVRYGEMGLAGRLSAGALLQTGLRWDRSASLPSLSVALVTRTPYANVQARGASAAAAGASAFLSASGGVTYGPGSGAHALPYEGVGQAGIAGRIFYDRDGDGSFGPGDDPAAGAPVTVGGRRIEADSAGHFHTWSVTPYEVVAVQADTLNFADPDWTPLRPATLLRPTPHLYNRADIPLVATRELSGTVAAAAGVATTGGVQLEILIAGDTAAAATTRTFSDGTFYLSRLRPGRYAVRVAETSLRALRACALPGRQVWVVDPADGSAPAELPPFRLIPRDGAAAAPADAGECPSP